MVQKTKKSISPTRAPDTKEQHAVDDKPSHQRDDNNQKGSQKIKDFKK